MHMGPVEPGEGPWIEGPGPSGLHVEVCPKPLNSWWASGALRGFHQVRACRHPHFHTHGYTRNTQDEYRNLLERSDSYKDAAQPQNLHCYLLSF